MASQHFQTIPPITSGLCGVCGELNKWPLFECTCGLVCKEHVIWCELTYGSRCIKCLQGLCSISEAKLLICFIRGVKKGKIPEFCLCSKEEARNTLNKLVTKGFVIERNLGIEWTIKVMPAGLSIAATATKAYDQLLDFKTLLVTLEEEGYVI